MTTTMTSTMEPPNKNLEANYTSHPSELVTGGVRSPLVPIPARRLIHHTGSQLEI